MHIFTEEEELMIVELNTMNPGDLTLGLLI